jgi:hypothetical protein
MRIGIDIRSLQTESRFRGIGTYTYNLIRHLLEIDSENEYIFFASVHKDLKGLESDLRQSVVWLNRPTRATSLTDQLFWYYTLKTHRIEIFHTTEFAVPRFSPCKRVITIYDLIPLIFQEYKRVGKIMNYLVYLLKFHSTRWAEKVITISESTKNDLSRILRLPGEKIEIVPGGVHECFQPFLPTGKMEDVKKKYRINRDYLIFPCGFEPRKNALLTIRAFHQALKTLSKDYLLVLTGNLTPESMRVKQDIYERGLEKQILLTGYISLEELCYLYNGAKLCLFPTLYEGFGLPVLEAMACGLPVITSNISSLPEIAGDAAILVNPYVAESIAEAIVKVLTNAGLQESLKEKGLKRAALFSWNRVARGTLKVYQDLMLEGK